jgi:hypothetical protein
MATNPFKLSRLASNAVIIAVAALLVWSYMYASGFGSLPEAAVAGALLGLPIAIVNSFRN